MSTSNRRERFVQFIAALLGVRARPPVFTPPPTAPPVAPPQAAPVPNATLLVDSVHAYLRFTVAVAIRHTRPAELATEHAFQIARASIQRRAEECAARRSLTQADLLRGDLAVALFERRPTAVAGVDAWAICLEVSVVPDDLDAVTRFEAAQRRLQQLEWESEVLDHQMRRVAPLLTDPIRATAWWLAQDLNNNFTNLPEKAQQLVNVRDILSPGGAAEPEEQPSADSHGRIVDDFAVNADPPGRHLFTHQSARLFEDHGRIDLADRMRALDGGDAAGGAQ